MIDRQTMRLFEELTLFKVDETYLTLCALYKN